MRAASSLNQIAIVLSFSSKSLCSKYPATLFHLSGFLLVFHKEIPCCSGTQREGEGEAVLSWAMLLSESGLDISLCVHVCAPQGKSWFEEQAATVLYAQFGS